MPYNLRSRSKAVATQSTSTENIRWESELSREEELELARILLSFTSGNPHIDFVNVDDESDSSSDVGADLDDDDDDYTPSDSENSVDASEEDEDEDEDEDEEEEEEEDDCAPSDDETDEDYVPSDDEADEDYVPEEDTDDKEQLVRDACSSLSRGKPLPSGFQKILRDAHAGNLPTHFVEWMKTIPPIRRMLNH